MTSYRMPGPGGTVITPSHARAGTDQASDHSVDRGRIAPRELWVVILHPRHLRRTCLVALLVGIWLTAFNEGAQLLIGPWNAPLVIKIAMNLLTPFVVANLGLLSRQGEPAVGIAARTALDASPLPPEAIEAGAVGKAAMAGSQSPPPTRRRHQPPAPSDET